MKTHQENKLRKQIIVLSCIHRGLMEDIHNHNYISISMLISQKCVT